MAFTDYTSPTEIRSLLGVSAKELKDDLITTNVYLTKLLEALDAFDPTAAALYFAARDAEPQTADQARFTLLIQSFCAYVVAIELVPALPNLIPKRITDGKSEVERNPFVSMVDDLKHSLAWLRTRTARQILVLNGSPAALPTTRILAGGVGLATDPITG